MEQIAVMPVPDLLALISEREIQSYAAGYVKAKKELEAQDDPEELVRVCDIAAKYYRSQKNIENLIARKHIIKEPWPKNGNYLCIRRKHIPSLFTK